MVCLPCLFQSYYSLISNHIYHVSVIVFGLFQSYYSLISNSSWKLQPDCWSTHFNPIIVLFLTMTKLTVKPLKNKFQSYYSLISNYVLLSLRKCKISHFNPIIVLFLTNHICCFYTCIGYFNPIIVLFLTFRALFLNTSLIFQSYYSLISNPPVNTD